MSETRPIPPLQRVLFTVLVLVCLSTSRVCGTVIIEACPNKTDHVPIALLHMHITANNNRSSVDLRHKKDFEFEKYNFDKELALREREIARRERESTRLV